MRASSLPILAHCTGSLVMPVDLVKSDNARDAADWGTMVHLWVQTGQIHGRDKRSENALRKAIQLSGIDRLSLWPDGGTHEGGLSLRVDGVREASRDDTPRRGWITGHFDFQWWIWENELWVDDLKTSRVYPNPDYGQMGHIPELEVGANRFPPKASSEQQRFYGLTLSELLGYSGPLHTSVTHWPRLPLVNRHVSPSRDWFYYSRDDLAAYWATLEERYQDYQHNRRAMFGYEDSLILVPGPWCKFCPARGACLMASDATV